MFKEAEPGNKEVNVERTEDALESKANIIATQIEDARANLICRIGFFILSSCNCWKW